MMPWHNLVSMQAQYPYCICDVWGVLHQGTRAYEKAMQALTNYRQQGGRVVLLTNAPMPEHMVHQRLRGLGINVADVCDALVTSGRLTQEAIASADKVFHWGPAKDLPLYQDKPLHADALTADLVVVTGMRQVNTHITPEDTDLLHKMHTYNVRMVCANPDIVVQMGDVMEPCAGAVAQAYQHMGGTVKMFGKPYAPAYERCLELLGYPDLRQVLAIGDGLHTDIAGANGMNIDALWLTGGVHAHEVAQHGAEALCTQYHARPTYVTEQLQ